MIDTVSPKSFNLPAFFFLSALFAVSSGHFSNSFAPGYLLYSKRTENFKTCNNFFRCESLNESPFPSRTDSLTDDSHNSLPQSRPPPNTRQLWYNYHFLLGGIFFRNSRNYDRPTDRPTNRPTDGLTDGLIGKFN